MTVEQMLRTMPLHELLEWRVFLKVERGGALTQGAIDLDDKIKSVFKPLCVGNHQWPTESLSN
jgi:hypothetical protein